MKNHQDNISTLPALLRTPVSVNTLETNSLCCAAASNIASSSATGGAVIPHERLRGAALADATLNAQKRPLAQPVVGYMTIWQTINLQCLEKYERWLPTEPTYFIARLRLETLKDWNTVPTFAANIIERGRLLPPETTHPSVKLKPKAEAYVQSLGVDLAPLNIGQPREKASVNPFAIFLSIVVVKFTSWLRLLKLNNLTDLSTKTKKLFGLGNLTCVSLISSDSHFMTFLTPRNGNRNRNTKNRTDRLYPPGSIRWQHPIPDPIRHSSGEQPQACATDHQTPHSPKSSYNHLFRNFQLHCSSLLRFFS
ncbi:hypothetical protein [Pseudomonas sp. Z18(2022)]|uniref:hypothetical protein n=1 Tax=Pseudomonas sp. Z18(2022) TaxID=2983410 RepID=UPI002E808406|nr:hypothetical protein [Pseudomonas sp. Z18(2022)]